MKLSEVINSAVGKDNGDLLLYINHNDVGLTSAYRNWFGCEEKMVSCIKLDDFALSRNLVHIDFIKIDTEGNEVAVLEGAKRLCSQQAIDMIQFEYGGTFSDAGTTLKDIYSLLSHNYIIFHLLPKGLLPLEYSPELETFRYSNWMAISHKWLETKKDI